MTSETREISQINNARQQNDLGSSTDTSTQAPEERDARLGVAQATERQIDRFLFYPRGKVIGVIDSPAQLDGVLTALREQGLSSKDIEVFSGVEGIRRIDPKGRFHGLLGRLTRVMQALGNELEHIERYEKELRAGHFVVVISAGAERRKEIARILAEHGGHYVDYFRALSIEHLVP
jgi:hypothetical protein